jgi:HD superfamily phosphohydrolase
MMYRTVYWHRQVRAVTAMVKKSLIKGLKSRQITGEDLYNLDDSSLFTLLKQKIKDNNGTALVESVLEGKIYATAAEISPEKDVSSTIMSIEDRAKFEENLAEELRRTGLEIKGDDIIIDIPELVSFETGLYVTDENCNFSESSSAFKPETVNAFIKTLYTIRIFINQKYVEKIKTIPKFYSIIDKLLR